MPKRPVAKKPAARTRARKVPAFDPATLGLRGPATLPPLAGVDPAFDADVLALDQATWSERRQAAWRRVCESGGPADLPHLFARLSPEAFDVGAVPRAPYPLDSAGQPPQLPPKDARAYRRAFDAVYAARQGRAYLLQALVPRVLSVPEGDPFIADRLADAEVELWGELSEIIVQAARPRTLRLLAAVWDRVDHPSVIHKAWTGAAAAQILLDADAFLLHTRGLGADLAACTAEERLRLDAICRGVAWLKRDLGPAWRRRVESCLDGADPQVNASALCARLGMGIDDTLEEPLLRYLDASAGRYPTSVDHMALRALAPIATARSLHPLLRALDLDTPDDAYLAAIERVGGSIALDALRRFIARHKAVDPATWPVLGRARAVLDRLEAAP
jgi:hypothetical protein